MSESIYRCDFTPEQVELLEDLRTRIAEVAGVTLQGNRLTVRWRDGGLGGPLVDVHMIIESVTTASESHEMSAQQRRWAELFEKHPGLEDDIYFAETGEHSQ